MRKDIHPELFAVPVRCACGASVVVRSTSQDIRTTICAACHPYYTGAQKFADTAGRIEKFNRKFATLKK
jgi:large subunit ribosomal protein L31